MNVEKHVEDPEPSAGEEKFSALSDDFESYLKQFRSSTSALFSEFDKKYGTKISDDKKHETKTSGDKKYETKTSGEKKHGTKISRDKKHGTKISGGGKK